jgi:hypothetical protein
MSTARSKINWPAGLSPTEADLYARQDVCVQASAQRVWDRLTITGYWPQWCPQMSHAQITTHPNDRLSAESTFVLEVDGQRLDATVSDYVPRQQLSWFGYGEQVSGYCGIVLEEGPEGCLVRMELTLNRGGSPSAQGLADLFADRGLRPWLTALKESTEREL